MKNKIKKITKWIWNKITEDPDEVLEKEEYDKFASILAKRVRNLHDHFGTIRAQDPLQLALLIENVRTQKQITQANESLKFATWILAIATIAFTIGTVYGKSELDSVLLIALQIIVGFVALGLAYFVLKGIFKGFKHIIKFLKK